MKKTLLGALVICCGLLSCNDGNYTANYRVVPLPQEVTPIEADGFCINGKTVISYNGDEQMRRNAEFLAEYIKESTAFSPNPWIWKRTSPVLICFAGSRFC